jgi:hypothetical protein
MPSVLVERALQPELLRDERLLWTGQPDPSKLFTVMDLFLIPFSLVWTGFVAVISIGMLSSSQVPLFMLAVPTIMLAVGLYLLIGRFIYKAWRKRHTFYGVTDTRAIIVSDSARRKVEAAFLHSLPTINKKVNAAGFGSVWFGNRTIFDMYANTGLGVFSGFYGNSAPAFHDIADADKVYRLVQKLRTAA